MSKSDSGNKKIVFIVIGILIVGLILGTFVFTGSDDSTTEPATDETGTTEEASDGEQGSQPADTEDEASAQLQSEDAASDDAQVTLEGVVAQGRAMEAEFDQLIASGCGDDVNAFREANTDLTARFTNYQQELVATQTALGGPEKIVDEIGQAAYDEVNTLFQTLEAKRNQLAEISVSCAS